MPFTNDYNKLVYNGIDLREYGLFVSGNRTFNGPRKEYDKVSIPGRSGDLVIYNGRYSNVVLEYDAILIENYEYNAAMIRSILLSPNGYVRLEDCYHPDEYRMALFEGPLDFDSVFLQAGVCTLRFNCQPQRWLKSGEQEIVIASPQTIVNDTAFHARPIFKFEGTGAIDCVITHGLDKQFFTIDFGENESDLACFVDSEAMNCYKEGYDAIDTQNEQGEIERPNDIPYNYCAMAWNVVHNGQIDDEYESATLHTAIRFISYDMPVDEPETSLGGIDDDSATLRIEITPGEGISDIVSRQSRLNVDTLHYPWRTEIEKDVNFTYRIGTTHEVIVNYNFVVHYGDPSVPIPLSFTFKFVPVSKSTVMANEYLIVDEFPVLHPGSSTITISGDNVEEASVIPRWYKV